MPDEADVLSQLAATFRLEGAMSGRFTLASPWGFSEPAGGDARVLVVLRGRVYLDLGGDSPREFVLEPGDVLALPHGDAHIVRDDPNTPPEPVAGVRSCAKQLHERHRRGHTELLVLVCRFADAPGNTLARSLPRVIHYAGQDGAVVGWLEPTIRLLAAESAAFAPGRTTILDRLAEVVFLQLVRTWLEDERECKGWLRALRDPRIARALSAIHTDPAKPWSVESLAGTAGMSRSAFAGRFRELVGETPLDYLTRWRMQQAAVLLRTGDTPLKQVIARSGYVSEAAFRNAFRKWVGDSPGSFRANAREVAAG